METKKKHTAHICNLIQMAVEDQEFHINEMHTIIHIARNLGITCNDFENILKNNENITVEIPKKVNERIQHLYDLVKVMIADNKVEENELKHITSIAKIYGFDIEEHFKNNILQISTHAIVSENSFNVFMDEFKKLSGVSISQIIVDQKGNISFPYYNIANLAFTPLRKTLYIFFLLRKVKNLPPISTNELEEEVSTLKLIYNKVYGSNTWETDNTINNLFDINSPSFQSNKSTINKKILQVLPEDLCEETKNLYQISNSNGFFTIYIDSSLIEINNSFLE